MTTAILYSKEELIALANAVDDAMGYPKDGVDVGGGVHAPREEAVTLRYTELRENPTTKGEWAYPLDATNRPFVAEKQLNEGKISNTKAATLDGEVVLSSDWQAKAVNIEERT